MNLAIVSYPDLPESIEALQTGENLPENYKSSLIQFIDNFISCSRNDDGVRQIVEEVNCHNHTKSCQKNIKSTNVCRFGFPKFPTPFTIISQPFPDTLEVGIKQSKERTACDILSKVKNILQSLPNKLIELDVYILQNQIAIDTIVKRAGVTVEEYYEALSISTRGTVIILKRRINEIYINNYNKEWILAWNGNRDEQICLDYFSVITYITDYYSKSESKVSKILIDIAKHCRNDNSMRDQMRLMADAFLTHRQMGESEAYYRMFPSLHLKESNMKCIFVQTGFKSNRHKFLQQTKYLGGDHDGFLVEGREAMGKYE